MQTKDSLAELLVWFPLPLRQALHQLTADKRAVLREIRLRVGRPVGLYDGFCETALVGYGTVTPQLLQETVRAVCEDSVHSYTRELAEGFVTVRGGHRVGLCGTAVVQGGRLETIKYISGLNFRLARAMPGCADELMRRVFAGGACSLLLLGAPGSGKTTLLRDLCRQLGGVCRVSVSDERGELAAVFHGVPQHDVGRMTDVLDGYPKGAGLMLAVRVLAPQVLVCDEIGGAADAEAILHAVHTGVSVVATAHAGSFAEAKQRPDLHPLFAANAFSQLALLGTGSRVGQVVQLAGGRT